MLLLFHRSLNYILHSDTRVLSNCGTNELLPNENGVGIFTGPQHIQEQEETRKHQAPNHQHQSAGHQNQRLWSSASSSCAAGGSKSSGLNRCAGQMSFFPTKAFMIVAFNSPALRKFRWVIEIYSILFIRLHMLTIINILWYLSIPISQ